jgi:purine-binding chemotaxis protein CheW
MARHMRGIVDFRGKVLPSIDMRLCLGMQTRLEERTALVKTLADRKQDHLNWLTRLKDAVRGGTEITVETDPHKCAFGRWYDSFTSDSHALTAYLRRFDQPHKRIHGIAVQARELIEGGQAPAAIALIDRTEETELAKLIGLFDGAEAELEKASVEYLVIVQMGGEAEAAIAVDAITHFGAVDKVVQPIPLPPGTPLPDFFPAVAMREREGRTEQSFIVDAERLLRGSWG